MWLYEIKNDNWVKVGEAEKLGWAAGSKDIELSIDPEGYFPFTRCCFSMGDWGIISALPEILKKKYPKLTVSIPSKKWLEDRVGQGTWSYNGMDSTTNPDFIFANNPYVDHRFNIGDYSSIITDHYRCYKYDTEPLVEQILRAWGFGEDEIIGLDTRPKLYFSEEEKQIGDEIISKYIGEVALEHTIFGCGIFAARVEKYNKRWTMEYEYSAMKHAQEYFRGYPVFVYNTFDIDGWDMFPQMISFKDIPEATLRIQMYLKHKAMFNFGYQSGLGDSCTGGSGENHIITPYDTLTETIVRGENIHYYFRNGSKVCYAR